MAQVRHEVFLANTDHDLHVYRISGEEPKTLMIIGGIQVDEPGGYLTVRRGAWLIMQSIRTNIARYDNDIVVNFKGFAPPKSVNDGNDLLFPIYTDQDLWSRYSLDQKGNRYPIVATYDGRVVGEFFVELR